MSGARTVSRVSATPPMVARLAVRASSVAAATRTASGFVGSAAIARPAISAESGGTAWRASPRTDKYKTRSLLNYAASSPADVNPRSV